MSANELHSRLQTALEDLKRAEQRAVLLFAEMLRRELYRELGYSSIQAYAADALGFSASKTSQFVRLAEALESLPRLRASVARGDLGWTKAREVAKVATAASEGMWIKEARRSSSRSLEGKVRAARTKARQPEVPALELDAGPELPADVPVTVSVTFTAEQYTRYEALMESLRKKGVREEKAELLLAALHDMAAEPETESAAPPYQVVVYTCKECGAAEVRTDRGPKPVDPGPALCDARVQEPGEPNRATIPPSRRREALARAGHRCEASGCSRTRFLEVHHIKPRAAGGDNDLANLRVLCSACHRFVHRRAVDRVPLRL